MRPADKRGKRRAPTTTALPDYTRLAAPSPIISLRTHMSRLAVLLLFLSFSCTPPAQPPDEPPSSDAGNSDDGTSANPDPGSPFSAPSPQPAAPSDGASGDTGASGPTSQAPQTHVLGREAMAAYDRMSAGERAAIGDARVLFHHHSIGENIMGQWTDDDAPGGAAALGFPFSRVTSPSDYGAPLLGELSGGDNGQPSEKIASLKNLLVDDGFGGAVDVVVFKFCFLDFGGGSEVTSSAEERALEEKYARAFEEVSAAHPQLRVIHITPPLNNYWNSANNDLRAAFAAFLRKKYDFVLDLQDIVSHEPDGTACAHGGVPVSCDRYVGGSGHLSGEGATAVGKALLYMIALP